MMLIGSVFAVCVAMGMLTCRSLAMADQPKEKAKEKRQETPEEKLRRAETFLPQDKAAKLYGGQGYLAAVYMRRIEFFAIPVGVQVHIYDAQGGGIAVRWPVRMVDVRPMVGRGSLRMRRRFNSVRTRW